MGGLAKKIPLTFWTFLIGYLALIGFPGFAGFFSKDLILAVAYSGASASSSGSARSPRSSPHST